MAEAREGEIKIDGSLMDGGGQIMRNSVTFACLLNRVINVYNIRAGRTNPGLRPQHMTGLQLVRDICCGKLEGDCVGSCSITLNPSKLQSGTFSANTKTAGSICLLMQVALPCLLYAPSASQLILKGGTDAEMAPPIDYMTQVFKPAAEKLGVKFHCTIIRRYRSMNVMLQKLGVKFDCTIIRRGYFPKGGGEVLVNVDVVKSLKPVQLVEFGSLLRFTGKAWVAGVIPYKVAQTMAREATKLIKRRYPDTPINIDAVQESRHKAHGNGTGIQVMAETTTGCRIAASALGRKGVPSEQVASDAVSDLTRNLDSGGCVDEHLQDQLIILMALANGKSRVKTGPLTMHTKTAIYVAERITKARFKVTSCSDEGHDASIIECDGIGLVNHSL